MFDKRCLKNGVAAAILILFAAATARGDVIYLGSGGVVKGTIVRENAREIVVRTSSGETIIAREEIERVERGASPEQIYREKLKKVALGDAEGHYQLGLWLKSINMSELARDEFQKTIMLEPEHKFARVELGYVRDGDRWVLPGEAATDPTPAPTPAAPKAGDETPPFKLDASGLSQDLAKAIGGLEKAEAVAAFEALGQAEAGESDRLARVLLGPFSRAREQAWRSLAKAVPAAEGLAAKVPAQGAQGDEAKVLQDELKPHLEAWQSAAVKPTIDSAVANVERRSAANVDKVSKAVRGLIKDWKLESARKNREKALAWWVAARDEAVKTIFDLKIYPDENHGRVGQKIVDEKVDKVRETWQFFDPMLQRDVAKFLAMPEQEAKTTIAKLDDARARRAQARAWLERRGSAIAAASFEDLEPVFDALLRYRSGDVDVVDKIKLDGAWEQQLLRRLRDQRVMDYNEAFRQQGHKIEKGKQPSGEEVEQVKITNEYRIMQGRPAIEIDPRLVEAARGHSEEMTRLGYFAHESPVGANKEPQDRMKNAGYPFPGGENISLGSETPKATHIAWYNSSGHHRNILGAEWAAMGAGKDGRHWTQDFGPAGTLKR